MNWIADSLTVYAAMAAVLLLTLFMFLALKREMAWLIWKLEIERDGARSAMEELQAAIRKSRTAEAPPAGPRCEETPAAAMPPPVPSQSVNLNRRSHALRLHRRGEPAPRIAAALQMPRNEVDLLLKVHRSLASAANVRQRPTAACP